MGSYEFFYPQGTVEKKVIVWLKLERKNSNEEQSLFIRFFSRFKGMILRIIVRFIHISYKLSTVFGELSTVL